MQRKKTEYRHVDENKKVHRVTIDPENGTYYVGNSDTVLTQKQMIHYSGIVRGPGGVVERLVPAKTRNRKLKNRPWYNAWGIKVPGPEWVDYAHTSEDL